MNQVGRGKRDLKKLKVDSVNTLLSSTRVRLKSIQERDDLSITVVDKFEEDLRKELGY